MTAVLKNAYPHRFTWCPDTGAESGSVLRYDQLPQCLKGMGNRTVAICPAPLCPSLDPYGDAKKK